MKHSNEEILTEKFLPSARGKMSFIKKAEVSYMNFQVLEKKAYSNSEAAIVNFMRYMVGDKIDSIGISYDI